jgi:peptidoglycan/xylan/chitin deacetylase (PgdA/CDA1 family)
MYHHVNSDLCSNNLDIFEKHLKYISENFTTVLPHDKLKENNICLTFDDAYADFYYDIFPLLKKYNLKALLAVPTKYILDTTTQTKDIRLGFKHNYLFENYHKATFCTFEELKEMLESNLIAIASHSHTHTNLLEKNINLNEEIVTSKEILETKLNITVDSFVFPFGKYDNNIANQCSKHYKYLFRIGNAIHKDFTGINKVIYRIDGDNLKNEKEIFSYKNILKYRFKALIKKMVDNK